jgi:4'-phosphopantetheinyl transferase
VSHGGRFAGVAVTRAGRVGLDVEPLDRRNFDPLLPVLLTSGEPEPDSLRGFLTYWTRKESAVKATGDGLVQPLHDVVVTGPDARPRLLRYGTDELEATMADLAPDADHVGALTVLTSAPIEISERWSAAVPIAAA